TPGPRPGRLRHGLNPAPPHPYTPPHGLLAAGRTHTTRPGAARERHPVTPFSGHAPGAAPARLAGRRQSARTSACTTSNSSSALNENWHFGPALAKTSDLG
ncbi:hypothetical protein ABZV46_17165, partial [Streptomyces sp. NPDC005209]